MVTGEIRYVFLVYIYTHAHKMHHTYFFANLLGVKVNNCNSINLVRREPDFFLSQNLYPHPYKRGEIKGYLKVKIITYL